MQYKYKTPILFIGVLFFIYNMLVRQLKYKELLSYVGKKCEFRSDCEFFPNFHVIGIVSSVEIKNNEYIINVKTEPTGKLLPIGSKMRNLTIEKL